MKYRTAGGFRQALEEHLRQQSLGNNLALTRLRKMVAFDRLLARLGKSDPEAWLVKGGFALQLRLGERTRTTKDIALAVPMRWSPQEVSKQLRRAAELDLHDWVEFEVGEAVEAATGAPGGGLRFPVRCLLDGRSFETFHLDIGQGDVVVDAPETVTVPNLLDFAEITPATVRCYPLATQIAEKLHAYSRTYASGATTRVRDLTDILLAASIGRFTSTKLRRAIKATFEKRDTHAAPNQMPPPPARLSPEYKKLARELELPWATIEEAGHAAAQFLNHVLQGHSQHRWNPTGWKWK